MSFLLSPGYQASRALDVPALAQAARTALQAGHRLPSKTGTRSSCIVYCPHAGPKVQKEPDSKLDQNPSAFPPKKANGDREIPNWKAVLPHAPVSFHSQGASQSTSTPAASYLCRIQLQGSLWKCPQWRFSHWDCSRIGIVSSLSRWNYPLELANGILQWELSHWNCPIGIVPLELSHWICPFAILPLDSSHWTFPWDNGIVPWQFSRSISPMFRLAFSHWIFRNKISNVPYGASLLSESVLDPACGENPMADNLRRLGLEWAR